MSHTPGKRGDVTDFLALRVVWLIMLRITVCFSLSLFDDAILAVVFSGEVHRRSKQLNSSRVSAAVSNKCVSYNPGDLLLICAVELNQ